MTLADRMQQLTFGKALMFGLLIAGLYYSIGYDSGSELEVSIAQTKEQIQDKQTEIKGLERQIERIKTMQKVMGVLGTEFDSFLSYIPEKMSMPDLMKIISTEAKAAGVGINGIGEVTSNMASRATSEEGQFYEEMIVEVELVGTYAQLLLFLSYLTKLDKILSISQLSMVSSAKIGDRESPMITFKCLIKGFRYLPAQEATTEGQPQ
ncbi:MAG: type 4a pilus biogenesis protein PilO [Bdellovibrionaceae bacterium]|nr:type 4a pilus biogenesis protein PilO [Bdellovibrionales bacterium]MCB9086095.1 type 4a pilus biogenesis protein PilO [Pseudobdellovibrionaceae bacterium]